MYCKAPHNSITIQPTGNLSICCAAQRRWSYGHISECDNLYDLWEKHQDLHKLRNDDPALVDYVCGNCLKNAKRGMKNSWYHINVRHESPRANIEFKSGKITFLEFTTSNICNQSCVTCSSYYSSKWVPLEQEAEELSLDLKSWKDPGNPGFNDFGAPTYKMSEKDVEKILPLLPDLEYIVVKGGEPFADNNNYEILKELFKVNTKCVVDMTTNMSKVPQKYFDLFKNKPNRIQASVSMDGIGKTYEWVRSTPFEQTIENIERWRSYDIKGSLNINHRINIFNMFNYNETIEFWNEHTEKYNASFTQMGWIKEPRFTAPFSILPHARILEWLESYRKTPEKLSSRMFLGNVEITDNMLMTLEENAVWSRRMHNYARFMNFKRGIDIYELHPELYNLPLTLPE